MSSTVLVLGAPVLVAVSNLVAGPSTARLGAPTFNLLRLLVAGGVTVTAVALTGSWQQLHLTDAVLLALSALVGLTCGDTATYAALARLGARRTGMLYATNGPLAALLASVLLGEASSPIQLGGVVAVVAGVWLAIAFRDGTGAWDGVPGRFSQGIGFGLLGALCQAIGVVLARPVMAGGVDPLLAVLVRLAAGLIGLLLLVAVLPAFRPSRRPDRWELGAAVVSGGLGTAGATLLVLLALRGGNAGLVATLASMTPVALLALLWLTTRCRPAWPAWSGAVLAIAGAAALVGR